ncbi:hypothetical protein CRENBAI_020965 [Crenichthys baileyi]|uniref:Uncharacterized protein n=1 Tax=Crenichthys baileyi TaxID=28760 RepID=A0AAV9RIE6_9TELE
MPPPPPHYIAQGRKTPAQQGRKRSAHSTPQQGGTPHRAQDPQHTEAWPKTANPRAHRNPQETSSKRQTPPQLRAQKPTQALDAQPNSPPCRHHAPDRSEPPTCRTTAPTPQPRNSARTEMPARSTQSQKQHTKLTLRKCTDPHPLPPPNTKSSPRKERPTLSATKAKRAPQSKTKTHPGKQEPAPPRESIRCPRLAHLNHADPSRTHPQTEKENGISNRNPTKLRQGTESSRNHPGQNKHRHPSRPTTHPPPRRKPIPTPTFKQPSKRPRQDSWTPRLEPAPPTPPARSSAPSRMCS